MAAQAVPFSQISDVSSYAIDQVFDEIAGFPLVDDFGDQNAQPLPGAELPFETWGQRFLPGLLRCEPGEHHRRAYEWFESVPEDDTPPALILAWNRGGAKSSTLEAGCVRWAFTLKRRFVLYISETQKQADKHVQTVRTMLERAGVEPRVTEFGRSAGWTATMLRTKNGFNMLALGLDSAGRGVRFDEFRPDAIIADDLDGRHDSPKTVQKKFAILTETIIPAGSPFCAIAFGQNVILEDGLMGGTLAGKLDWLNDRIEILVSAVQGFRAEQERTEAGTLVWNIVEGISSWPGGLPMKALQAILRKIGLRAFQREYQNDVSDQGGGLWDGHAFQYWFDDPKNESLPDLVRVAVAVDPSGSARGDEVGIVAAGKLRLSDGTFGYLVVEDASERISPQKMALTATRVFREQRADKLCAEVNFGGEMVDATLQSAPGCPPVTMVRVSRGKLIRAEPIHSLYEQGRVWHVKRFPEMEREMTTWHPESGLPSPGRLDAVVIALSELAGIADYIHEQKPAPVSRAVMGSMGSQASGEDSAPRTPASSRRPSGIR